MDDLIKRADEALEGVTPGPWDVGFVDENTVYSFGFGKVAQTLGDYGSPADWPRMEADARFIAAARELVPAMRDRIEADAKRIQKLGRELNIAKYGEPDFAWEMHKAALYEAQARAEAAEARVGDDWDALMIEARAEAEKAMRKFPQPNYVISKVAEEAGEVVKAAIHCAEGRETVENLRGEMKQLIAMIYRLWVEGDGVHGLPPARAALTGEKG